MTEPRVEYRADPQHGRTTACVYRYEDGVQNTEPVITVNKVKSVRVAGELNVAVATGVRLVLDQAEQGAVADAIRRFDWDDYGLDNVGETLRDPNTQEWVDDLAQAVARALRGT